MAENAFKNFWDNINTNPVLLAGVAQVIVPLLVVFDVIHWTESQTAMVYTAITAITTLMVRGNTVAVNKVEQRVEEKVAHREMAGTTGTGTGMNPPDTPGPATPGIASATKSTTTNFLLVIALAGTLAGCTKGAHVATQAEDVIHDGLIAFDHALDARCDSGQLTPVTCKTLNQFLVPVWDLKNEITKTILSENLASLPTRVAALQKAIKELGAQVDAMVNGAAKTILMSELDVAMTQAGQGVKP